jgi:adenylate kinase family enzyme
MSGLRAVVVGTSGSGKTTAAGRIAKAAGIPQVELDQLNWGPGWYDRSKEEPQAFITSVDAATSGEAWVAAGGYSLVRPMIWSRASHVLWLDYPRSLVMRQVIGRSLWRAFSGGDVFPGCKENITRLFSAEHPIRWAWNTHARRRATFEATTADPAYAHLTVFRVRSRAEGDAAIRAMAGG